MLQRVQQFNPGNALADIAYDLQYLTLSPLKRAQLLFRQALLLSYQGNQLAQARMARLNKVLFRLSVYNVTHDHVFSRIDRNAEEALYGPRVCPGCNTDIEAEWFDDVCKSCQFDGPTSTE